MASFNHLQVPLESNEASENSGVRGIHTDWKFLLPQLTDPEGGEVHHPRC